MAAKLTMQEILEAFEREGIPLEDVADAVEKYEADWQWRMQNREAWARGERRAA